MAKLIVIDGPDRGTEYPLPEESGASSTLGRDPRNKVPLNDASVSREHLRIEFTGRDFRIVDLGSKNRTFLNGEPVREGLLRSGDLIGVGDTELRFEDDRPEAEEAGIESTIIKELPASGGAAIDGMIDAIAGSSGQTEERLTKGLENVRKLLSVSQAISRSGSLDDLFRDLLAILVPALLADQGVVLAPSGRRWVTRAVLCSVIPPPPPPRGRESSPPTTFPRGREAGAVAVSESIVRRVAEEEKAILSANTRRDERFQKKASIIEASISSVIAAPIFHHFPRPGESAPGSRSRTVVGVIYADRRGPDRPFGEADLALLTAAAEQAGAIASHLGEEERLRDENRNLLRSISQSRRLIGRSRAMNEVLEFIRRAAPATQTVLIRGETGTGKELVASAIHYQSNRQGKPFVPINCAAIPDPLIESELFGHERGAFTGAVARRKGRFEMADGGTVFLDEVGELSPGCQAKLLRLLEDRRFERLGGFQPVEVDVRIIAATNKDLGRAISEGKFREDLFYRLNVLGITLPPLRERKEDVPQLATYFLEELGGGRRELAPDAEEKLLSYHWPGNIRQFKNVIESAVVLSDGPQIRAADLILPRGAEVGEAAASWEPLTLLEVQRRHILKVLEFTGGNKKRAADLLGIERCTLYAKLKSLSDKGDKEIGKEGEENASPLTGTGPAPAAPSVP
jgi:Nif-specific regulatory protein